MEENRFPSGESKQLLAEEIYKEYRSIRAGERVVLIGTPIGIVDAIRLTALRRVLLLLNRLGVEFCVSEFRQSQEWRCRNRAESGLNALLTSAPEARDGMRASA